MKTMLKTRGEFQMDGDPRPKRARMQRLFDKRKKRPTGVNASMYGSSLTGRRLKG
ncbi:hypothetical protein QWJ34_03275 [Saccharibacillus sp. CPCC 101409]|uniref:hypothetical protein n=1 Tax=Saccharibacillus sp. CPCC 101409 TaxID=3058041 RepID=UPI002673B6A4|nr:hypothetical protein [Saccharibacillus sp. CPCC 101409]MDO3408779.1 hypothetical protein [Saccharibacillus sp. CPCC 101409]